jgi:predicted GIY-YIG superfamily endonuclease
MYSPPPFYYVYIMTNRSKTLYTGVTGYLERRVLEHKQGIKGEFAARYKIDRLVYFERLWEYSRCDCAREADQGTASHQEDRIDCVDESGMEGFE